MISREKRKKAFKREKYLLGVATATGMSALHAKNSGSDFVMVLNSGKFRQMGRSSLGGYLPFANSNQQTREIAEKEILPVLEGFPMVLGVNATDPLLVQEELFSYLHERNVFGIVNYPSICLFDGQFREALEEEGLSFSNEVELLRAASIHGLFTIGFASTAEEAEQLCTVQPDVICIHLGLTKGGYLGAKRIKSFESMVENTTDICKRIREKNHNSIIMIYGGILNALTEVRYLYNKIPDISGYIGGSTFERIGSEQLLNDQIRMFKHPETTLNDNLTIQILEGVEKHFNYVDFVKTYIEQNYSVPIYLSELAEMANLNASYLSDLFKKKTGVSFTDYLTHFRLNKAIELMNNSNLKLNEIARSVGYPDYAQFNKIFRKKLDVSPKNYMKSNINTTL